MPARSIEGGSTITQQLVKQTLLQAATTAEERQAATEESVGRKLREARLALALEQQYTKAEILTRYLNMVYFGRGAYGIQAAAWRYFSVDAADLTLPQAAMLAGLVQTPANDDPITNPEGACERRNQVLQRMLGLGHITDAGARRDLAQPVAVAPTPAAAQRMRRLRRRLLLRLRAAAPDPARWGSPRSSWRPAGSRSARRCGPTSRPPATGR